MIAEEFASNGKSNMKFNFCDNFGNVLIEWHRFIAATEKYKISDSDNSSLGSFVVASSNIGVLAA